MRQYKWDKLIHSFTWVVAVIERTKVGTVEQLRFSRRPWTGGKKTKQKQQHKVRVQVKNTHTGSRLCVKMYLLGGIMKRNQYTQISVSLNKSTVYQLCNAAVSPVNEWNCCALAYWWRQMLLTMHRVAIPLKLKSYTKRGEQTAVQLLLLDDESRTETPHRGLICCTHWSSHTRCSLVLCAFSHDKAAVCEPSYSLIMLINMT